MGNTGNTPLKRVECSEPLITAHDQRKKKATIKMNTVRSETDAHTSKTRRREPPATRILVASLTYPPRLNPPPSRGRTLRHHGGGRLLYRPRRKTQHTRRHLLLLGPQRHTAAAPRQAEDWTSRTTGCPAPGTWSAPTPRVKW